MAKSNDNNIRCSFCGRTQEKVEKLIAGNGAFICNECVKLCMNILDEDKPSYEAEGHPADRPAPEQIPVPRR